MNFFISTLLSLLMLSGITLGNVRNGFKTAKQSEENAIAFNELMQKNMSIGTNVKLAYLGASEVMLADYGINIPQKISQFKKGRDMIESAVSAEPNNIEVRLVRLVIQDQIPRFLKYKDNIEEDKEFVLNNFSKSQASFQQYLEAMNKDLNIFTAEEFSQRK